MAVERGKYRIAYSPVWERYFVEELLDAHGISRLLVYSAASHAECAEWLGKIIASSTPEALEARERAIAEARKAAEDRLAERDKRHALGWVYNAATDEWRKPANVGAA